MPAPKSKPASSGSSESEEATSVSETAAVAFAVHHPNALPHDEEQELSHGTMTSFHRE